MIALLYALRVLRDVLDLVLKVRVDLLAVAEANTQFATAADDPTAACDVTADEAGG